MRILIVDDDPEIRLIAGHLLREAGHEVVEVADGAAAAAALQRHPPDLLLMDVMLGDEDGVETAVRLRLARARLIFLTGATGKAQRERMKAAGAVGIIDKPFDPVTFVAQLETLARGSR